MKVWHAIMEGASQSCDGEGGEECGGVACDPQSVVLCDEVGNCDGDEYGCDGNHYCAAHRAEAEAFWAEHGEEV